ncbi:MAG: porin family protein [Bacteroidetes bacterium]|nr:porin family protein [Bacteroidota bacterium]
MKTKSIFAVAIAMMLSGNLFAQEKTNRFGFELNTGASVSTAKPGNATLNPGFGFEGLLSYEIIPQFGLYGGWGYNRFGADESFAGNEVSFEETGYILGLQFRQSLGNTPWSLIVKGAGLYNHIEIENKEGELVGDTGHGFGFQAAAGMNYALGKNWSLAPGIKFNFLDRDVEVEGVNTNLKHHYLSLRLGIVKKF